MSEIMAIANQKGGVGKTTTTINLSAALAEQGKRVLIIDMDPQGNTSSGLGIDKDELETTVYQLMIGDNSFDECVQKDVFENLDVLAANVNLAGIEIETMDMEDRNYILRDIISEVEDKYDFIIIDCPPSLNTLTINSMTTADSVLVPIQCEYYALEGLSQLIYTINLVKDRLNPKLTIHYVNEREGEETTVDYHEPEGICAYVKKLNEGKQMLHEPVYFKRMIDGIEAEVAFQYTEDFGENILGFCNNIYTIEGGTHITGFKTKFTTIMNQYAREIGVLKEKDSNFTGTDVRNGMTAIVSVKHPEPRFEGQTKTKLDNPDAAKAVGEIAGEELVLYFDKNLDTLKKVLACAEKSAKIRKAEEKAKTNMLVKQKLSIDSNGKLANCESRKAQDCEIFIVEGDSAGGSAKTARNRKTQAILPIRGKILNVEKATMDKVLANAEIKTMINAFGCGFSEGYGNDFDISKLRYHKIIIMTDADVDGAHIATLLLTFFYRFMPELITHGHVFLATPPLYKAMPKKGEETYLFDDAALTRYRAEHKGNFTLQRYKGLGEMDAQQLWETTLNPESRTLKQIEIEDARMASDVTSMLMGSDVPPRRQFIYENANEAMLDI